MVVAKLKPAYLIHGTEHGRIAERRAGLRAMGEKESGANGVEVFEGESCTPEAVAGAMNAMTFGFGRRILIVDGVQRWKQGDVEPVANALSGIDPEAMTVAFFAREEGRTKAPAALHKAVTAIGGQVVCEAALKAKDLPAWLREQGRGLGLDLDAAACRTLVDRVGERQQRLLRELEKLAIQYGQGARLSAKEIELSSAPSSEEKLWTLGDAIVDGNAAQSVKTLLALQDQGERLPGLIFTIARRLRDAHTVAVGLEQGKSPAEIKQNYPGPPFVAERMIAKLRGRSSSEFRDALELLADVEFQSRGGDGAKLADETLALKLVI